MLLVTIKATHKVYDDEEKRTTNQTPDRGQAGAIEREDVGKKLGISSGLPLRQRAFVHNVAVNY